MTTAPILAYASLTDLLREVPSNLPLAINLTTTTERDANQAGVGLTTVTIKVQAFRDDQYHVLHRTVASWLMVGTKPINEDAKALAVEKTSKLYSALIEYLEKRRSRRVVQSTYAFPEDVQIAEGYLDDVLKWDEATGEYVVVEPATEPPPEPKAETTVPVVLVTVEDGRVSQVFSDQPNAVRVLVVDFDAEKVGDEWLSAENVWYPSRDALDDEAWDGIKIEARVQGIVLPAVDRK